MAGSKQTPISIVLKTEGTQAVTSALRGVKQSYLDLEKDIAAAGAAGSGKRTAEAQKELKAKIGGLREEAKLVKEVNAARAAEIRAARAEHQFNTSVGKPSRDGSVYGAFMQGEGMGGMLKAAGVAGLAIGGMSAAINLASASLRQFSGFVINEVIRPAMQLKTRSVQIANNSGGKLTAEGVEGSARSIGIRNNVAPGDILEAAGKFQDKTGEPGLGLEMMQSLATLSKGRGLDMGSLSEMAAALYRPGQKKEDLTKMMLALTAQGEAGSVPMRELAMLGGRLTAPAEKFGGNWFTKVATANAILQTSRRTGFGSVEAAAEGLQAFSQDSLRIGKALSPKSIAKLGGVETIVDPIKMIGDFYRRTAGNVTTLHGMGFTEPAAKLISSYQGTYSEARTAAKAVGKTDVEAKEAGATAVEDFIRTLATSNTTMAAESEKRDAVMATDGERIEAAMTKIKAAILAGSPSIGKFVDELVVAAPKIGEAAVIMSRAMFVSAELLIDIAKGIGKVKGWFDKATGSETEAGRVQTWALDEGANTRFPATHGRGHWEARKNKDPFDTRKILDFVEDAEGQEQERGRVGHWERTATGVPVFRPGYKIGEENVNAEKTSPAAEHSPGAASQEADVGKASKVPAPEAPNATETDIGKLMSAPVVRESRSDAPGAQASEAKEAAAIHSEAQTAADAEAKKTAEHLANLNRQLEETGRLFGGLNRIGPFTDR